MPSSHVMPFGAALLADGVRFALWAPSAREVVLLCDAAERPLSADDRGWYSAVVPAARAGSRYAYRIDGTLEVPDPASRSQPDGVKGRSLVVDPAAFAWSDGLWKGRPWEEVVLTEVHVGTATPAGTFAALTEKLTAFRDMGLTAIELLPLADCPGTRNWGYDGVLPFAPNHAYGSPDDLKRLVDRAHALDLMVLVDVVYNHFGPDGNFLPAYAKTFFTERHETPWGAAINFDAPGREVVRDFFVHNALYWLEEFHVDGLRFDAVHAFLDDSETHFLGELATRLREGCPGRHVHLTLENEKNQAGWLTRTASSANFYDAQWDDDIHHCWHRLLTGEAESYYADFGGDTVARLGRALAEGFVYQGEVSQNLGEPRGEVSKGLPPQAFVAFLQNHDQVGNRAFGERLSTLANASRLELARAFLLLSPQIPMLFMGEEWGAKTPFLFFVDFADDPALSKAVRDGRRREFKNFATFAAPGAAETIPDPTAETTFTASKLDWNDLDKPSHAAVLNQTRALTALRATEIVPLLKSEYVGAAYRRIGPGGLEVVWTFAGGTLAFIANFDGAVLTVPSDVPGLVLWQSEGIANIEEGIALPAWAGLVIRGAA